MYRSVLPPEAQARRQAGLKHVAVAKVSFGNAGERAVPKAAEELAAHTSNHLAHLRRPRAVPSIFCNQGKASGVAGRNIGHVSFDAGDR